MNKTAIFGLIAFFFIMISVNVASAEVLTSDAGVKYESEILEELNTSDKVMVIVRLKDNSNISIEGTIEEKREQYAEKDIWFEPVIENVVSSLEEDGFELKYKYFDGFAGRITKEGFEKLIKNQAVEKVHLSGVAHTTSVTPEKIKNLSISENGSLIEISLEENNTNEQKEKSSIIDIIKKILSWLGII